MKYAAAAFAVCLLSPAPATAQAYPVSTHNQINCLMRAVPEEARRSSAHTWLASSGSQPVDPTYAAALDTCSKTHRWLDEQRGLAYEAMMYRTRMEEIWDLLEAAKVDNALVNNVADALFYANKRPLLDPNWRKDAALDAGVKSMLAAQGIKDEETQRLGGDLIFAADNYIDRIQRWEAKWPPPPPPPRPLPPAPPRPRAPAPQ
jgi:hypothetical protein